MFGRWRKEFGLWYNGAWMIQRHQGGCYELRKRVDTSGGTRVPGDMPQTSIIWIGDFHSLRDAKDEAERAEFGPIRAAGGRLLPMGLTLIKAVAVPHGARAIPLPRGLRLARSLRLRDLFRTAA